MFYSILYNANVFIFNSFIEQIGLQQALIFLLLGSSNTFTQVVAEEIVKCNPLPHPNCGCELDNNGGIYNLSVLHENKPAPLFHIRSTQNLDISYSYDPCQVFSTGSCVDVAGCKLNSNTSTQNVIAKLEDLTYNYEYTPDNGPLLTLQYTSNTIPPIHTDVILLCDAEATAPSLVVLSETDDTYAFALTSNICSPTKPYHSISFGTFLCIVVPIIFFCYFGIGFMYLFFVKHESWENAIPHHEFWASLPGLIKDGVLFTWMCITGPSSNSGGYDQI